MSWFCCIHLLLLYIVLVLYYVRLCTLKDRWYIMWANVCVCVCDGKYATTALGLFDCFLFFSVLLSQTFFLPSTVQFRVVVRFSLVVLQFSHSHWNQECQFLARWCSFHGEEKILISISTYQHFWLNLFYKVEQVLVTSFNFRSTMWNLNLLINLILNQFHKP